MKSSFPILILTARDTLSDELTAHWPGADDFLTKPCHLTDCLQERNACCKLMIKLRSILQIGTLSLDTDTYKLLYADKVLILSETEGKIMKLLMEQYPGTVEKSELFRTVWGTEEFVDENILQVNMSRLRKKSVGCRDGRHHSEYQGKGLCVRGGKTMRRYIKRSWHWIVLLLSTDIAFIFSTWIIRREAVRYMSLFFLLFTVLTFVIGFWSELHKQRKDEAVLLDFLETPG